MRSSHDRSLRASPRVAAAALALAVSATLAGAACGTDTEPTPGDDSPPDPDTCEQSYLSYDNFGEPFMLDWCNGCHSSAVPAGGRQLAPIDVNFDTIEGVRQFSERILVRAVGATDKAPTMPPAGGPGPEERAMLAEWIACGAK